MFCTHVSSCILFDLSPQQSLKVGAVICSFALSRWRGMWPRLHMVELWLGIWLAGLKILSMLYDITGLQGTEENAFACLSAHMQCTHTGHPHRHTHTGTKY